MDWEDAKRSTIELWQGILSAVGEAEEVELLSEINAACDLCAKAHELASEGGDVCHYCLAYQQFGGCRKVNLLMSEMVVEQRWNELRRMASQFIRDLESMDVGQTAAS